MRLRFAGHLRVVGFSVCAAVAQASGPLAYAQADRALEAQLLAKAQTLESRGRLDLATPVWQQVLLMDARNLDALAGLARAARQQGNEKLAQNYMAQWQAVGPAETDGAQAAAATSPRNPALLLGAAGNLARAGQPVRAMVIYREVYGDNPPAGVPALAYYETEAATTDGHGRAVAGLRGLVRRYPEDTRYAVALGRVLAADPETRAEGRGMLEGLSNDPEAKAALQQLSSSGIGFGASARSPESFAVGHVEGRVAASSRLNAGARASLRTSFAAKPVVRPVPGRTAELQAAYGALNQHFLLTAEANFESVLTHTPRNWQAIAGLGYVRLRQGNFSGAISFLEQAKEYGAHGAAIERALGEARFRATLQAATIALDRNDYPAAQEAFTAALKQRPGAAEALRGLGGTLLQAQQGEAAIEVFRQYTQAHPADPTAWHGLLVAQATACRNNEALATEAQIPFETRRELMQDPRFLLALATVDTATGNTNEAQAVLDAGLDLPFPAGGRGLTPDLQTHYAALLAAASRPAAAMTLYRQVLAADAGNTAAWTGLIGVQQITGETDVAAATLHGLPPAVRAVAMRDPAFVTVAAGVQASQGHGDQARSTLEALLAEQAMASYHLYVPAQLALAGLYVRDGDLPRALPIYREILRKTPGRLDAWKQLVKVLHATEHDAEAVAELRQMPAEVRSKLERDAGYLQLAGDTYAGAGEPKNALASLLRAQQSIQSAGTEAPASLELQVASLEYATREDAALSEQLAALGGRTDLSTAERSSLQSIWADWAVRRAVAEARAGNPHGAAEVLNTALEAFSTNAEVARTLAEGFVAAGLAKDAEAIFRARDMTEAPAVDFRAAITAALAANDYKLAETWLQVALHKYPDEPQLLLLASRYEDARGHERRAKVYLQASAEATTPPLAEAELARELTGARAADQTRMPGVAEPGTTMSLPSLTGGSAGLLSTFAMPSGRTETPAQGAPGQTGSRLRDFPQ